jgi:uncharacterized RDD family membrane protein YckC
MIMKYKSDYAIAKFWYRIGAIFIDTIILGLIGFILSLFFENNFRLLGEYGVFVGFFISLIYFTFFNSYLLNGQTIGKRIAGIMVIDYNDQLLSIKDSFIRSLILTFPYFCYGVTIPGIDENSQIQLITILLPLILSTGLLYYYIFNVRTRQSIHDIFVKSYVVEEYEEFEKVDRETVKPIINYVYYGFMCLLLSLFVFQGVINYSQSSSNELKRLQTKVNLIDTNETTYHKPNILLSINNYQSQKIMYCNIIVYNSEDYKTPKDLIENKYVNKGVTTILKSYSDINNIGNITINLNSGYNIGIFKKQINVYITKSPKELDKILNSSKSI